MVEECERDYRSIVSKRWNQMMEEADWMKWDAKKRRELIKCTDPEDDQPNPLVGHKEQLEEKVTEQPVIKHVQRQLKKALRSQELLKTGT